MSQLNDFFKEVRSQFPQITQNERSVYLDSAATALKPQSVVDRISRHYLYESANVHRGAHRFSDEATGQFEDSRQTIARFLNCDQDEIIFTRNTTESINLVAQTWGRQNIQSGDTIVLTALEHHGNIVPWQMIANDVGAKIVVAPLRADHSLDEDALEILLKKGPRILAITGASNVLGVRPNLQKILQIARQHYVTSVVDAAQLVVQQKIDLATMPCDFLAFSGHKIFGPTGIGILFGRSEILKKMPPFLGGGSMISKVSFQETTYQDPPFRFEAGTPHIAGAIGLGAAIRFLEHIPWSKIQAWEEHLDRLARQKLKEIPGMTIYGDVENKGSILSFNIKGLHHSDVAQILDQNGVAIRAGHLCAQPLMKELGTTGVLRASFSIYNNENDVHQLVQSIKKAVEILA